MSNNRLMGIKLGTKYFQVDWSSQLMVNQLFDMPKVMHRKFFIRLEHSINVISRLLLSPNRLMCIKVKHKKFSIRLEYLTDGQSVD